jgi:dihydrofolate reductase
MVIGGAAIYHLFLPLARRLYLTAVDAAVAGDTFFPAYNPRAWQTLSATPHPADARHPYAFTWHILERQQA